MTQIRAGTPWSRFEALCRLDPHEWAAGRPAWPDNVAQAYGIAVQESWREAIDQTPRPAGDTAAIIKALAALKRMGAAAAILTAGRWGADAGPLMRAKWSGLDDEAAHWLLSAWRAGEPIPDGALVPVWVWAHRPHRSQRPVSVLAKQVLRDTLAGNVAASQLLSIESQAMPTTLAELTVDVWQQLPPQDQLGLWKAAASQSTMAAEQVRGAWPPSGTSPLLWVLTGPVDATDTPVQAFGAMATAAQRAVLAALDAERSLDLLTAAAQIPKIAPKWVKLWSLLPASLQSASWRSLLNLIGQHWDLIPGLIPALLKSPTLLDGAPLWLGHVIEGEVRRRFDAGDSTALPLLLFIADGSWSGIPPAQRPPAKQGREDTPSRVFAQRWARTWAGHADATADPVDTPLNWAMVPIHAITGVLGSSHIAIPMEALADPTWLRTDSGLLALWRRLGGQDAATTALEQCWADESHPIHRLARDAVEMTAQLVLRKALALHQPPPSDRSLWVSALLFAMNEVASAWAACVHRVDQRLRGVVATVQSIIPAESPSRSSVDDLEKLFTWAMARLDAPAPTVPALDTPQEWRMAASTVMAWRNRLAHWSETETSLIAEVTAPLQTVFGAGPAAQAQWLGALTRELAGLGLAPVEPRVGATVPYNPAVHHRPDFVTHAGEPVYVWSCGIACDGVTIIAPKVGPA